MPTTSPFDFDQTAEEAIKDVVAESVDELNPRFEDFVPVLAMRRSREKLMDKGAAAPSREEHDVTDDEHCDESTRSDRPAI